MRLNRFIEVLRESVQRIEVIPFGGRAKTIKVWSNPTAGQLQALTRNSSNDALRGLILSPEKILVWDAYDASHEEVAEALKDQLLDADHFGHRNLGIYLDGEGKIRVAMFGKFNQSPILMGWARSEWIQRGSWKEYANETHLILSQTMIRESYEDPNHTPKTYTLEAGTRVYHGTQSNKFKSNLQFPAWVSNSPEVAEYFVTHHEHIGRVKPRILELEVIRDQNLIRFDDRSDINEFLESRGEDSFVEIQELVEIVLGAGYDGWIIPNNYPTGADILLGNDCLRLIRSRPFKSARR